MRFLPLLALLATSTVAVADEEEADTCLRTKIWAGSRVEAPRVFVHRR